MGHPAHFLERLDRLSTQHTEEALLLYNDPELLRRILAMARVPERVERVALALADDGPYVVVTRAGRFVTCLAAGMTIEDAPIVSRDQLDDITSMEGELRARMELARSLVGTDEAGGAKLLSRLITAGADLSREEFAAIALWQPLIVRDLLIVLGHVAEHLVRAPGQIALLRLSKRSRQLERVLHDYWNAYWASGHLTLLLAVNGSELFTAMPEPVAERCRSLFGWGALQQGDIGSTLRGSWAVGHLGESMLPLVKQRLHEARSTPEYLTRALSLMALAVRHPGLRAAALEELSVERTDAEFRGASMIQLAMYAATFKVTEGTSEVVEHTRLHAERSLTTRRQARHLPSVPLPGSHLLPVACLDTGNFELDSEASSNLLALVAHAARSSAEGLYLPRADLATFGHGPWTPAHSTALLRPQTPRPRAPATAPESVGRNDPCTCGSGKKSKKCCAA